MSGRWQECPGLEASCINGVAKVNKPRKDGVGAWHRSTANLGCTGCKHCQKHTDFVAGGSSGLCSCNTCKGAQLAGDEPKEDEDSEEDEVTKEVPATGASRAGSAANGGAARRVGGGHTGAFSQLPYSQLGREAEAAEIVYYNSQSDSYRLDVISRFSVTNHTALHQPRLLQI